jgi:hypothetical protein
MIWLGIIAFLIWYLFGLIGSTIGLGVINNRYPDVRGFKEEKIIGYLMALLGPFNLFGAFFFLFGSYREYVDWLWRTKK